MRIIAGEFKGRIIKFPKSKLVRPTTDKFKESLFNYLNTKFDFEESQVCDIYAGSGSLGLEALSRGARSVHFVEKNFNVGKVLRSNIESLKTGSKCRVFLMDAVKFSRMKDFSRYDLVLADPPFFKFDIKLVIDNLIKRSYLNPNGILIVERSVQTEEKDTEAFGFEPARRLGDSLLYEFIQPE